MEAGPLEVNEEEVAAPQLEEETAAAAAVTASTTSSRSNPIYITCGTQRVKARIDDEVPLSQVLFQLTSSPQLRIPKASSTDYVLRSEETGKVVTEDQKVLLTQGGGFLLIPSPSFEVTQILAALTSTSSSLLKSSTFALRTHFLDPYFLANFLERDGLQVLEKVVSMVEGNTLAYALVALEKLVELAVLEDRGDQWPVKRIVEIIATHNAINVIRPATSILSLLLSPSPSSNPITSTRFLTHIYHEISLETTFLENIVKRLSSDDLELAGISLNFVTALLRGATELGDLSFGEEVERLGCWKVLEKTISSQEADEASLLRFQAALLSSLSLALTTTISPEDQPLLDALQFALQADEQKEESNHTNDWRAIGFRTNDPGSEFEETGLLGLKLMARMARDHTKAFQSATTLRSPRACPLLLASSTCTTLLAQHFGFSPSLSSTLSSKLQLNPLLYRLYDLHRILTAFFLRMSDEGGVDFRVEEEVARIRKIVEAQLRRSVGPGKSWWEVKGEFQNAEYVELKGAPTIRAASFTRHIDKYAEYPSLKNLRSRIYSESYNFVKAQRLNQLRKGTWFLLPRTMAERQVAPSVNTATLDRDSWRFYRLSANMKTLRYTESDEEERREIKDGVEELGGKLEISDVSRLYVHSEAEKNPTQRIPRQPDSSPPVASFFTFTLYSQKDEPLITLMTSSPSTFSEWTDGLAFLLRPSPESPIDLSDETTGYINTLTEMTLQVKLLDISAERVELGIQKEGEKEVDLPSDLDYCFAEL